MAVLSYKIFQVKKVTREKKVHSIIDNITILNIYPPSNRAQIYEGKLTIERRNSSLTTVEHFNRPLSIMDTTTVENQ